MSTIEDPNEPGYSSSEDYSSVRSNGGNRNKAHRLAEIYQELRRSFPDRAIHLNEQTGSFTISPITNHETRSTEENGNTVSINASLDSFESLPRARIGTIRHSDTFHKDQTRKINITPEILGDDPRITSRPYEETAAMRDRTSLDDQPRYISAAEMVRPHVVDDDQTTFDTARSRLSFRSLFTRSSLFSNSTGFRSINGATWRQELIINMNSGFGPGAPRNQDYKGIQEGRERGGFLPRIRGVGRLGKRAVDVPDEMVQALRRQDELRREMKEKAVAAEEAAAKEKQYQHAVAAIGKKEQALREEEIELDGLEALIRQRSAEAAEQQAAQAEQELALAHTWSREVDERLAKTNMILGRAGNAAGQ